MKMGNKKQIKYMCGICQKNRGERHFNKVKWSPAHPDRHLTVCKDCINDMLKRYCEIYNQGFYFAYGANLLKATEKVCSLMDIYYSRKVALTAWKNCNEDIENYWGKYIQQIALPQYHRKTTFDETTETHFARCMVKN